MDLLQNVHRLSGKQLRGLCSERGIDTSGLVEKQDFRRAILADTLRSVSNKELRSLRDAHRITTSLVNKNDIIDRLVASLDSVHQASKSSGGQSHSSSLPVRRESKEKSGTPTHQRPLDLDSKQSVAGLDSKRHGVGNVVDWQKSSTRAAAAAAAARKKDSPPHRRRSDPGNGGTASTNKRAPSIKSVASPIGKKTTQSPFAVKLQNSSSSAQGQLPRGRKLGASSHPKNSKQQGSRPRSSTNLASGGGGGAGGSTTTRSSAGMVCAKCSQRIRKRDGHVKMEPATSTSTSSGSSNRAAIKKSVFFYHRGCFRCEMCTTKPEVCRTTERLLLLLLAGMVCCADSGATAFIHSCLVRLQASATTSLELSAMRVNEDGEVFCRQHFLEHSAEAGNLSVCLRCLGPIDPYEGYVTMKGESGGTATGKNGSHRESEAKQHCWHSACFTCADCGSVDSPKMTLSSAGAQIAARSNATRQGLLLGKGKAWGAFGQPAAVMLHAAAVRGICCCLLPTTMHRSRFAWN